MGRALEEVANRVLPGVVQIFALGWGAGSGETATDASDLLRHQEQTGSGVVVDASGWVVTNAHVVEAARRVRVRLPPSPEDAAHRRSILKGPGRVVGARVVGRDRETDVAVLKLEASDLALPLGDSDDLRPGQIVFAFGSPLGLEGSVSMDVVSATARQFQPEDPMIYIQTDASINPGNSGGPLVDVGGSVVGIIYRRPIGSTATLGVLRASEPRTFDVEVVERTDVELELQGSVSPERNLVPELGILALDLSPSTGSTIARSRICKNCAPRSARSPPEAPWPSRSSGGGASGSWRSRSRDAELRTGEPGTDKDHRAARRTPRSWRDS